jgi:hypothetical protein
VIRPFVRYFLPTPFLLGVAMIATAFWQNDADFVFGDAVPIDAVFVDSGPSQSGSGRPRYFPVFQLPDGRALRVERATVASELPQKGQTVQLRCSTKNPGNCKMPGQENDIVFYGIAVLWSLIAAGVTYAMWRPLLRDSSKGI